MQNKKTQSEPHEQKSSDNDIEYIRPGDLIQGRFLVIEIVGEGSFGTVFKIHDQQQNNTVLALKVEYIQEDSPILQREIKVLIQLQRKSGFPQIKYYGEEKGYKYCIMSLLGKNLESVLRRCGGIFTVPTVLKLAIQILNRIETFHTARFIHRDIKPDNFVLGTGNQVSIIHIIDFGLSKYYMNSKGEHIPNGKKAGLIGTARYASTNAHEEMEQSRRDDLESIGYILIYFASGSLPWMNLQIDDKEQKYAKIHQIKKSITTEQLCEKVPKCFINYINDVRNLQFKEKPNYQKLKSYFQEEFEKVAIGQQFLYDWEKLPEFQSLKKHQTVHLMQNYDEKKIDIKLPKPPKEIEESQHFQEMLLTANDPLKKNIERDNGTRKTKKKAPDNNILPITINVIQSQEQLDQQKEQSRPKIQFQGRSVTLQKGTYLEPPKKDYDEQLEYKYLPSLATTRKNNYEKSDSVYSDDGNGLPIWQDHDKLRKQGIMNGIKKPSVILLGKEHKVHTQIDTLKSIATSFIQPQSKEIEADDNDFDC